MKIIIIGATSGLGRGVAERFAAAGHQVGITGRRTELLRLVADTSPDRIVTAEMDVNRENAVDILKTLIETMQGVDLIFYSSGFGKVNPELDVTVEDQTNRTNVVGFTRIACFVYHYFKERGKGHFAVISSVAGWRGLRGAPSYSASKGYQRLFFESLAQTARRERVNLKFTTVIPGFVDTEFLKGDSYPLTIPLGKAVRIICKGLLKRKRYIYVDVKWRCIAGFMRVIPARIWERMPI